MQDVFWQYMICPSLLLAATLPELGDYHEAPLSSQGVLVDISQKQTGGQRMMKIVGLSVPFQDVTMFTASPTHVSMGSSFYEETSANIQYSAAQGSRTCCFGGFLATMKSSMCRGSSNVFTISSNIMARHKKPGWRMLSSYSAAIKCPSSQTMEFWNKPSLPEVAL